MVVFLHLAHIIKNYASPQILTILHRLLYKGVIECEHRLERWVIFCVTIVTFP